MEGTTRRRRRATESVTIRDVAREAGVSTATVSRVLAENYPVAAATRTRVLEAVERLDYTANPHARALSGAAPGPIAVLLGDITGPSFAAIAQGAEREGRDAGRLCLVGTTDGDPERELALVEMMREQKAAAVILPGGVWGTEEFHQQMARYSSSLRASGGRLVLCGRPALADDTDAISIQYDNEAGAAAVARYTAQAGHRRFLLLPGAEGFSTAEERLIGYRSALAKAGVGPDGIVVRHVPYNRDQARRAVLDVLDATPASDRPTAVLCGADVMAAGVLEGLRSRGLRCPQDVSVTGFDDVPGARDMNPALTTVRVPYEEMGARAVRMALYEESPARPVHLKTELIVRDSVGPVPGRA
ncbi:LacI family transcriptional regulator [Kineosporia rhizophila]|uniref:LacI family DNA-binding transcriptional regulator n=1 Tax=Kineosporia TaxID=49184 RepID=UPI001E520118|nr:LacI family DNA-binding transcriptional regulator [Kineosporia sp. NBRC 101677]MCE0535500.1 LacI family transcriptional regulator [Kineosporia rhizophila]GLY16711.1 LacI family transcriptional regulator [Kineosporia sp. NBRC 101677]